MNKRKNIKPLEVNVLHSAPENQMKKRFSYLAVISIFLFSFLLYANTFHHGWVLDDYGVFVENRYVTAGVEGWKDILTHTYRDGNGFFSDKLYRPISQMMFALEWEIMPEAPGFYHLMNTLYYALTCVLTFVFLRKILKSYSPWIPFLITLLFAAHPIHTEVVANIKSRDEIVSVLFVMLTLLSSLSLVSATTKSRRLLCWCAMIFSYLFALFTKESAITLLALLPLTLYFFTEARTKDYITIMVPMVIAAAFFMFVRQQILNASPYTGDLSVAIVDNYFYDENLITSWATAIFLLGKYLLLLFIPYPLVCDYSYNQLPLTTFADFSTLLSLLVYLALFIFAVFKFKKKSPISYAIFFFIITMSIYSNLVVKIGSSFAERFLYFPSLAFCIAIVVAMYQLFNHKRKEAEVSFVKYNKSLIFIVLSILISFSSLTVARAAEWKDQYTLFGSDVKKSENSAHLRLYWGLALYDKAIEYEERNMAETRLNVTQSNNQNYLKYLREAANQFWKATEIYPNYAQAYEQLGLIYMRIGEKIGAQTAVDTAEFCLQKSIALLPEISSVNSNLAKIYFMRQQYDEAKKHYLVAIQSDPHFVDGYFNLGSVYGVTAQYDSSLYYYQKTIELDPNFYSAYAYMGLTYANLQKYDEAISVYDEAIKRESKNVLAYILKLRVLIIQEKWNEAQTLAEAALQFSPFDSELLMLYGKILVAMQNETAALQAFSQSIQYNPRMVNAYLEKAAIFERRGMADSAQIYLRTAQTIK